MNGLNSKIRNLPLAEMHGESKQGSKQFWNGYRGM